LSGVFRTGTVTVNNDADGELYLNNGVTTLSCMDGDTLNLAGFTRLTNGNYKGGYDPDAGYAVDDIVLQDGYLYIYRRYATLLPAEPDKSPDWDLCVRGFDADATTDIDFVTEDGEVFGFRLLKVLEDASCGYGYGADGIRGEI
jgi:hypothetical protein